MEDTMRSPFLRAAAWSLFLAMPVAAAPPPQIERERVRIGLPGGQDAGRSRNSTWAPVYVPLQAGPEGNSQDSYRIVIETADVDDAPYRYTVPVPALSPNERRTALSYVHPGSDGSEFTVKLQTADGQTVQALPRTGRDRGELVGPRDVLFLAVGSRLPTLKRALARLDTQAQEANKDDEADVEDRGSLRFAFVESVDRMPDRWFGYEAVDVVVLTTTSDTFVTGLLAQGEEARRHALVEWVRRGGRLVVSVGRNQQLVRQLLAQMKVPLLDCPIQGKPRTARTALPAVSRWSHFEAPKLEAQAGGTIDTAVLAPGPGVDVLVREDGEDGPMIVQGSCGLGRVVLVAFDLDTPPFSTWKGRQAFWKELYTQVAPPPPGPGADKQAFGGFGRESQELSAELRRGLESFEEVPVISFGWVALFILLYIALVGPLDYFILKKVFKRLELTWVTFPTAVLLVSVAAYFTAYYVKGDDLRIKKIDLVEIDLHGPRQAYGTSWFTLFSPRIQTYTVGVEPSWPGWTGPPADVPGATVVSVLEGQGRGLRTGSQSLFRRPYDYADDAGGLRRVPIPVWATQAFTASWQAPLPAGRPPLEADLHRSRTREGALWGTITNHLPVELQGVTLFYRGKWYTLGDLAPEEGRSVERLFERDVKGGELVEWFNDPTVLRPAAAAGPAGRHLNPQLLADLSSSQYYQHIKRLMFYGKSGGHDGTGRVLYNSGLRHLDQSWRLGKHGEPAALRYREEVILVGRGPLVSDQAETVTQDGVSPGRLWLGRLPAAGTERPALHGVLTQETYVRVYIPVKPQ
jgi:hypothetical protein